ncbi:MAG: pitrilysin family protein [Thermoanaerobaculia bacterium]|nr:pitrilysin family protein [Thermoanaerobaculia bacterium]
MIEIEQYSLANGLRVCLNHDASAPLVAVNLWYHVGSKDEVPGRTGFAHLFEHMLFSGSEHVGNNEHFRYVQSVGGVLNGTTFFDRTNYYETLPSNYLSLALWLESDRMGFFLPALTREKLDIQKQVVQEERRLRYDNAPYGTWFEELLRLAYPENYPYHWPTIGSMADIEAATLDDVTRFFERWYQPQNAVLTLVGDFDQGEAHDMIETYFGEIPGGDEPPSFGAEREAVAPDRRTTIRSAVQLPRLFRLYHLPPTGERVWFSGDLLSGILAGGKSSRLERTLVYERKLAQDVSMFVLPTEATGMLILSSTARPGVPLRDLESAIDGVIEETFGSGPTDDEILRVRNQTEADHAHQIEQYESRADLIGMFRTFFGDATLINGWLENYAEAAPEELREDAIRIFAPENRVTVEFLPEASDE